MNTADLTALLDRLRTAPRGYLVFGIEDAPHVVVDASKSEFFL